MTETRCVVVGDVVGSRDVDDRETLHERLEAGMARANEAVESDLAASFSTLKGVDEIGGVLVSPRRSYRALREIATAIHPVEIRFAVVWGRVDICIDADDVAVMDGPAFHEADSLLADLSESDRYVGLSVEGTDGWLETLLSNQMHLIFMWKYEWTPDQGDVIRSYRDLGTMEDVAMRRDVSVQAVSQMLSRAKAPTILALEEELDSALAELWGEMT